MTGELFYNVHPHVDEERLVSQWLTWQPRAVLVMNNPQFAMRLQALRPNALVIARQTPDNDAAAMGEPGAWLAKMTALVPDKRVVLYAGNECHTDPAIPQWTLDAMWLATEQGRRLCILNTGTGGPEDEEWWADTPTPTAPPDKPLDAYRIGALDAVARAWAASEHLLGLHEYATMLDWKADRGWQVERYERHLDTFGAMGIPVARSDLRRRLAIAETTFDSIPVSEWKGARWLPALDAAKQMIEVARQVYWEMPVLMYCLGHNSDPQWRMFRLDYAGGETVGLDDWGRTFQAAVGAYMTAGEGEQVADTQMMTVTVLSAVKKRAAPHLLATQMGTFEPGAYILQVGTEVLTDGYRWRYFTDGNGGAWYSATGPDAEPQQWISLAVIVPEPEPEPEPEPPTPVTPEQWLILLTAWDTLTTQTIDAMQVMVTSLTAFRGVLLETIEMVGGGQAVIVGDVDGAPWPAWEPEAE